MVLGLGAQVLEDTLFPVSFHVIPVLNHSMSNRIVHPVRFGVGNSFIANEEVQILNTAFGGKVARL